MGRAARTNTPHERQVRDRGFTLIELLDVVLIAGILSAIAIPTYLSVIDSAKDASAKAGLVDLKTSVTLWITRNPSSATLPSFGVLQDEGYVVDGSAWDAVPGAAIGSTPTRWCINAQSLSGTFFHLSINHPVQSSGCSSDPTDW